MPKDKHRPPRLDLKAASLYNPYSNFTQSGFSPTYDTITMLDEEEEKAVTGDNHEYGEIDLESECSSPAAYTPGRFLQLCDVPGVESMDDVTLWPVSLYSKDDRAASEAEELVDFTYLDNTTRSEQVVSRSFSSRFVLPKVLVPRKMFLVFICFLAALTAFGCVAGVI